VTTKSMSNANSNATDRNRQPASQIEDSRRSWLWWFLVVLAASQLYFVRELVAAFALFAIAFAAIAFVVASLCMLTKAWELAFIRLAELRHPVMSMATVATVVHPEERKAA